MQFLYYQAFLLILIKHLFGLMPKPIELFDVEMSCTDNVICSSACYIANSLDLVAQLT